MLLEAMVSKRLDTFFRSIDELIALAILPR
jgi:hypothetical protein